MATYEAHESATNPTELMSSAFLYLLTQQADQTITNYKLRPVMVFDSATYFSFSTSQPLGSGISSKNSALLSLPMFAKFSGLKSVKEVSYERLAIKMKEQYDTQEEHRMLLNDLRENGVESYYKWVVRYQMENPQKVEQVDNVMSMIFSAIIAITMFLCFFSLSASMSANLYEQAKEIGILRALGLTSQ